MHFSFLFPNIGLYLCSEWAVNQHRDSMASFRGHPDALSLFAMAENQTTGRVRYNMLEKMVQPCGPPPPAATGAVVPK
jgi:hypothetical protein